CFPYTTLFRSSSLKFPRKANCSDLKPEELLKLKEYPLCPSRRSVTRMRIMELYEPNLDLDKLELPILDWPTEVITSSSKAEYQKWSSSSAEADFLRQLGLNRAPSALTLVKIASKVNITNDLRNRALVFFASW